MDKKKNIITIATGAAAALGGVAIGSIVVAKVSRKITFDKELNELNKDRNNYNIEDEIMDDILFDVEEYNSLLDDKNVGETDLLERRNHIIKELTRFKKENLENIELVEKLNKLMTQFQ